MGFKFKRIDLLAGSAEFPTTDTSYAGRRARSLTIMEKIGQAILDCNCGWTLDSRTPTVTDFADVPTKAAGETYPGLFFVNTISGCKLFVAYIANQVQNGMKDFGGTGEDLFQCNSGTNRFVSSFCMSMIPGESLSEFGDLTTTTFLPSDATRIVGTDVTYESDGQYGAFAAFPTAGWIYSYGLFVSPYCIAVSTAKSQTNPGNLNIPSYAVGRILGTLAHASDTTNQAKYGVVTFRKKSNIDTCAEGTYDVIGYTQNSALGSTSVISLPGRAPNLSALSYYLGQVSICCCVSKADGSWINGSDNSTYSAIFYVSDSYQLSGYLFNSVNNGKSRWVPMEVMVVSSDLETYGIVPGDGFKGYLDTDLFRCALGTYGQTFDNGNFICCDSTYNFLIGWDADNTDSLAGA